MSAKKLSPQEKVAILLLALGEEAATPLLKAMPQDEARSALRALSQLGRVEKEAADAVMREFRDGLKREETSIRGGAAVARQLLFKVLPSEALDEACELASEGGSQLAAVLNDLGPTILVAFLVKEKPAQIAVALAHMDGSRGAACLKLLPLALRVPVIQQLASLDSVSTQALEDLTSALQELRERSRTTSGKNLGGREKVAALVSAMDPASGQALLQNMKEREPELAEAIKNLLFQFGDLAQLPDKSMVEILKKVPPESLKLALKNAPETVARAFLKNMSERAQTMLKEDIAAMGLVKKSDVTKAQQTITEIARNLIEEGKIMGPGSASEFV